jgi:hypothetical protein
MKKQMILIAALVSAGTIYPAGVATLFRFGHSSAQAAVLDPKEQARQAKTQEIKNKYQKQYEAFCKAQQDELDRQMQARAENLKKQFQADQQKAEQDIEKSELHHQKIVGKVTEFAQNKMAQAKKNQEVADIHAKYQEKLRKTVQDKKMLELQTQGWNSSQECVQDVLKEHQQGMAKSLSALSQKESDIHNQQKQTLHPFCDKVSGHQAKMKWFSSHIVPLTENDAEFIRIKKRLDDDFKQATKGKKLTKEEQEVQEQNKRASLEQLCYEASLKQAVDTLYQGAPAKLKEQDFQLAQIQNQRDNLHNADKQLKSWADAFAKSDFVSKAAGQYIDLNNQEQQIRVEYENRLKPHYETVAEQAGTHYKNLCVNYPQGWTTRVFGYPKPEKYAHIPYPDMQFKVDMETISDTGAIEPKLVRTDLLHNDNKVSPAQRTVQAIETFANASAHVAGQAASAACNQVQNAINAVYDVVCPNSSKSQITELTSTTSDNKSQSQHNQSQESVTTVTEKSDTSQKPSGNQQPEEKQPQKDVPTAVQQTNTDSSVPVVPQTNGAQESKAAPEFQEPAKNNNAMTEKTVTDTQQVLTEPHEHIISDSDIVLGHIEQSIRLDMNKAAKELRGELNQTVTVQDNKSDTTQSTPESASVLRPNEQAQDSNKPQDPAAIKVDQVVTKQPDTKQEQAKPVDVPGEVPSTGSKTDEANIQVQVNNRPSGDQKNEDETELNQLFNAWRQEKEQKQEAELAKLVPAWHAQILQKKYDAEIQRAADGIEEYYNTAILPKDIQTETDDLSVEDTEDNAPAPVQLIPKEQKPTGPNLANSNHPNPVIDASWFDNTTDYMINNAGTLIGGTAATVAVVGLGYWAWKKYTGRQQIAKNGIASSHPQPKPAASTPARHAVAASKPARKHAAYGVCSGCKRPRCAPGVRGKRCGRRC